MPRVWLKTCYGMRLYYVRGIDMSGKKTRLLALVRLDFDDLQDFRERAGTVRYLSKFCRRRTRPLTCTFTRASIFCYFRSAERARSPRM